MVYAPKQKRFGAGHAHASALRRLQKILLMVLVGVGDSRKKGYKRGAEGVGVLQKS